MNTKYSQELPHHAKQSPTDALKTASKKQFKKPQKQLVIWLELKILIKLQVLKTSKQNNSERNKEEILRERCISPEER